ncbi:MAG: FRG domain-containing protein [Moraxella sp.]|nr:FRG domain-containing protein [Moraxella sp.]
MSNAIRIESVSDFVNALSELGECNKDKSRFFRGHSNCCYQLIPSIYRQKYLIENEHRIIQDAFTYCSNYFSDNETLFEKLVKLQHYDYKTRLLDITSNALVALYFAIDNCKTNEVQIDKEVDGEVIIFDIPTNEIKYPDSDTVAILSAISLQNSDFDIDSISIISQYFGNREKALYFKNESDIVSFLQSEPKQKQLFDTIQYLISEIGKLPNNEQNKIINPILIKEFNSQEQIIKILNDIRKDKPYFLPNIQREHFNQVLCVRAKHTNPRILKQHGAFLIFGINGRKIYPATMQDWQRTINNKRIIIDRHSKKKILDELEYFGISRQTLFPELDKQATQIINRYKDI